MSSAVIALDGVHKTFSSPTRTKRWWRRAKPGQTQRTDVIGGPDAVASAAAEAAEAAEARPTATYEPGDFAVDPRDIHAVNGVTLRINAGEIFGFIGFSGAGKSTLVRLLNGLEKPTAGRIEVLGEDVTAYRDRHWRPLRREIGMVFQHFNLFTSKTVAANVAYPLKLDGMDREKREARVAELLDFVGLADKADAYPDQLSGGQKQRVGIARALARSPKILLADEATSALDPETTREVLELIKKINEELGITVIIITHSMDVVKYTCHRVAVMEAGKVVELGDVYQIFSKPTHRATERFVGSTLRDRPPQEVLDALAKTHPGRFVCVEVDDETQTTGSLLNTFSEFDVDADVVFGGVSAVANRPFGSLTFSIRGDDDAVAQAIEHLRAIVPTEELHPRRAK